MARTNRELEFENARLWSRLEAIYADLHELLDPEDTEEDEEDEELQR